MDGGDVRASDQEPVQRETSPLLPQRQEQNEGDNGPSFGKRHLFSFLGFLGFANVYAMRVNLSVAIVAMVNNSAIEPPHPLPNTSNSCPMPPSPTNHSSPSQDGPFDWDPEQQGTILGAFFWGYVCTQLPGGMLAERYGGKLIFGLGILVTSVFTILTPLAARGGFVCLIICRIIEGLGEGVTFPVMHAMLARWSPKMEVSKMSAFTYAGAHMGTVVSLPLTGLLCDAVGWQFAFYASGSLGVVWFVAWMKFVYNGPDEHPYITVGEKRHIMGTDIEGPKIRRKTPWGSILRSKAMWAIFVAHVAQNFSFYLLLNDLPTYLREILHFDIEENGFLSALPYLAIWIAVPATSILADHIRQRNILSTTGTRRLFNSIGAYLPAVTMLLVVPVAGCDRTGVMILMVLTVGLTGFTQSGFGVNHIDIAPNFAGTLMGITNMGSNTMGFVAPWIVGLMTEVHPDLDHWHTVYCIAATILFVGNTFYILFASGEEQAFNQMGVSPNRNDDPLQNDGMGPQSVHS